ncbi:MAG: hypothetical protein FJX54_07245 [Alphaproteobacteria bacterium]|nr:hypothetical protein [Alphaproteobacteria bacterium]
MFNSKPKGGVDKRAQEAEKKAREAEAEARKVEAIKVSISQAVEGMRAFALAPSTDRCEAAAKRVTELLKNPKAPKEFVAEMRARSDDLLKSCFMKAASEAAAAALNAAHHDDKELLTKKIGEAKTHLARALQLKAPPEFKMACNRALEAASMTGFVQHDGPTKAKPADFAPKPPDRAHGSTPMKFEQPKPAAGAVPPKPGMAAHR